MIDLLLDMLRTPEAQADPHYWASVAFAHTAVGLILTIVVTGALSLTMSGLLALRRSVLILLLGYTGWEVAQIALADVPDYADGITDWLFTAAGSLLASALIRHRARLIAAVLAAVACLTVSGVRRRK